MAVRLVEQYRRWFEYEQASHAKVVAALRAVPEAKRSGEAFWQVDAGADPGAPSMRPVRSRLRMLLVALLVAVGAPAQIPRPEVVLGFRPGTDYKLADYGQISKYFQALAQASNRIRLVEIGRSEGGRPIWMAMISAPRTWRS